MFCRNCGEKIPDESLYCMFCGKSAKSAEPIEPDSKEPIDSIEEEWEGRAVWEACRREQEQKQLELAMQDALDLSNAEMEPELEPKTEVSFAPALQDISNIELPNEDALDLSNAETQPELEAITEANFAPELQDMSNIELPNEDALDLSNAETQPELEPITEANFAPELQDISNIELPSEEDFILEEPNLPEPDWDMQIQNDSATKEDSSPQKVCKRCGKPLSETSISDFCLDCLYSPDVLRPDAIDFDQLPAEMDAPKLDLPEKSAPARKNWMLTIVVVIAAVIALGAAAFFLISKHNDSRNASNMPSQSTLDRKEQNRNKAIESAHKMIKEAAYAPDSIHFNSSTLECTVEAGDYTVTEQFERKNPQGEVVTATYTAVLNLGGETGYLPIMLKVDDSILFDHR